MSTILVDEERDANASTRSNRSSSSSSHETKEMQIPLQGEALEEVCTGIMLAELAITDNKEGTLRSISKTMPWHSEALKLITGSESQAHKPLSTILDQDMDGLQLDHQLDVSGITRGGHFLDTQGFIAHNESTIVLSFRCATSAFDWLTNFNTTSSAWEVEEDLALGYSGFCSGFNDFCCTGGEYKPRVHTGFYNNFLAALPHIQKHIDPLLSSGCKPRKLYVVGHSLGAGIATLAGCYFMTQFQWKTLPHRLVIVTAGSPRAVCTSMKYVIDEKRRVHGDKCRMYRVVKGRDIVTRVPPKLFGFCHLIDPIQITDQGLVVLQTKEEDPEADLLELTKYRANGTEPVGTTDELQSTVNSDTLDSSPQSKYERLVSKIPRALRDHMPDFYLKPVLQTLGRDCGSTQRRRPAVPETFEDDEPETTSILPIQKDNPRSQRKLVKKKRTWLASALRPMRKTAPSDC